MLSSMMTPAYPRLYLRSQIVIVYRRETSATVGYSYWVKAHAMRGMRGIRRLLWLTKNIQNKDTIIWKRELLHQAIPFLHRDNRSIFDFWATVTIYLTFQKLETGTSTSTDVREIILSASFSHSGCSVTATYNGSSSSLRSFGAGFN